MARQTIHMHMGYVMMWFSSIFILEGLIACRVTQGLR
jgi:hypothetical protein